MLDHPRKTQELFAALKAAVPFEVELPPAIIKQLRDAGTILEGASCTVSDVSYADDYGGILCHIIPEKDGDVAIVVSLTYVRISGVSPLATSIRSYQKHRLKKLKKEGG
jgi:hypothetical protein